MHDGTIHSTIDGTHRGTNDRYGLYIHVPFCSSRCGYCDFNTYTAQELGTGHPGNTIDGYLDALERELELAAEVWARSGSHTGRSGSCGVDTVFFGGGTPSMIGSEGLTRALRAVKRTIGLAENAEVTTESNPESTSRAFFDALRSEGFTRVSLGMQSVAGHVLKILERAHTPGRPVAAAKEAAEAGFEHINLDLIYGTPTETDADLSRSLDAVLEAGVDHVSAYSLIVEDGTAMARKVRRGELPRPDEDVLADRYQAIDARLRAAGMEWYEVSNWATPGGECRHNLLYWTGGQWWGAGPGAHGCVDLHGGTMTRLVNHKHPRTYWNSLLGSEERGELPGSVATVEELTSRDLATERVMLGLRLRDGVDLPEILDNATLAEEVARYENMGLLRRQDTRVAVTDKGRYLADGIVTDLVLAGE